MARNTIYILFICTIGNLALAARAGETPAAAFTTKPTVTRSGDKVRIDFAIDRETDVIVFVENGQEKVVRHLVAGALGRNAPGPLKAGSLEQSIEWDGKDDVGQPALGGPFKVRVKIGSKPRLGKIVGWDGNTLTGGIAGLTVGNGGDVYVLQTGLAGLAEVRVFDARGKYTRTIMPYPASVPKERAASLGQLEIDGDPATSSGAKERLPVIYNPGGCNLAPLTSWMRRQNLACGPQGRLVMVSGFEDARTPRHLLALDAHGGAPEGMDFVGPKVQSKPDPLGVYFDHLAISPDGRQIYVVLFDGKPRQAVFRLSWADKEIGAAFVGKDGEAGADETHLNDPQGLGVDREGRLYVCDRGNNRVALFSPDGRFVGQFPTTEPEQIAVHHRSGEIYVLSRRKPDKEREANIGSMSMEQYRAYMKAERERKAKIGPPPVPVLSKFSAWPAGNGMGPGKEPPRRLDRLELGIDLIALDPESEPGRIWASVNGGLVPIADKGDRFEVGEPVTNRKGMMCPTYLAADPARGRVLVREHQQNMKNDNKPIRILDLKTGAWTRFLTLCDVTIDEKGNIYFIRSHKSGPEAGIGSRVDVFGPDGRKKQAGFIDGLGYGDCGIGIDARGNVYVGMSIKPAEAIYPQELAGKLPDKGWMGLIAERGLPWCYMTQNQYLWNLGSVVKFGPEGGKVYGNGFYSSTFKPRPGEALSSLVDAAKAPPDAKACRSGYARRELRTVGVQWIYLGAGVIPQSEDLNHQCSCLGSQLAVDGYGRVFAPDCFLFSVEMLDTNGNRIHRIGRYGNADSAGPGSAVPGPEIAFAWPNFVSVAEGKVYVSDTANHRVVMVRFEYAAEGACALP